MNLAANSKFEQRIYDDALKLYTKAVEQAPHIPKYLTNRAAVYLTTGQYDECIIDCTKALRLDPSLVKAHTRVARAMCELGEFEKVSTVQCTAL